MTLAEIRQRLKAMGDPEIAKGAERYFPADQASPRYGVKADPVRELGGTRHLSGAQFAFDQRDAQALVASQDGRFTVFAWSPAADAVMAYRVEALLL